MASQTVIETDIENAINEEDKMLYIEDLTAPGEQEMIICESLQYQNSRIIVRFIILFLMITLSSAISCYLNYTFSSELTVTSFIMLCCSILGDHFALRPLIILFLSLFRITTFKVENFCQRKKVKPSFALWNNKMSSLKVLDQNGPEKTEKSLQLEEYTQRTQEDHTNLKTTSALQTLVDQSEYENKAPKSKQNQNKSSSILEYHQLHNLNMQLNKMIQDSYGDRSEKVCQLFRTGDVTVLRIHYLKAILNPIHDYSKDNLKLQVREHSSVHSLNKQKHGPQIPDFELPSFAVPMDEENQAIEKLPSTMLKVFNSVQFRSIMRGQKPHYEAIKMNQSIDVSQRTQSNYASLKHKQSKYSTQQQQQNIVEENCDTPTENDLTADEIQQLKVIDQRIQELNMSVDEGTALDKQQNAKLSSLRLQRLKIQQFAAERNASKAKSNLESQQRLNEINEEMEQVELENLLLNSDSLTEEQAKRLNQLKQKQLQRLRVKLSQKNKMSLTFDEAASLKELIPQLKVSLSPLEQHRLREQLKRHNLFSKKEQDLATLQELRLRLKPNGPSLQLKRQEVEKISQILQKYGIDLPDDEKAVLRQLQKALGFLTKEQIHMDLLKDLRLNLAKDESAGLLTKSQTLKLIHLTEKYGIPLSEKESENFKKLKSRYGLLSQKEKDLNEFERLLAKLQTESFESLQPNDLKRLLQLKEIYGRILKLTSEQEESLKAFEQKVSDVSHYSSMINGDPVVFKGIDEVMNRRGSSLKRAVTYQKDNNVFSGHTTQYFKEDLTNYSKGLGLDQKQTMLHNRRQTIKPGMISTTPSRDLFQDDGTNKGRYFSNNQHADYSQSLRGDDSPQRRTFINNNLTPNRRDKSDASSLTAGLSNAMKHRLEILQEIYLQEARPGASGNLTPQQIANSKSPANQQASPFERQISVNSSPEQHANKQAAINNQEHSNQQVKDQIGQQQENMRVQSQPESLQNNKRSQSEGRVNYESENERSPVTKSPAMKKAEKGLDNGHSNIETTANDSPDVLMKRQQSSSNPLNLKQSIMINRFAEDSEQMMNVRPIAKHTKSISNGSKNHVRQNSYSDSLGNASAVYNNQGPLQMLKQKKDSITGSPLRVKKAKRSKKENKNNKDKANYSKQLVNFVDSRSSDGSGQRDQNINKSESLDDAAIVLESGNAMGTSNIRPTYRELRLKQISEALGSQGSSQSSRMTQQPFNFGQASAGTNNGRVRSQDRTIRSNFKGRARPEINQMVGHQSQSQERAKRLPQKEGDFDQETEERKEQAIFENRNVDFILQQDEDEKKSDNENDDICMSVDNSLQKVKIKKKKQQRKIDYNSPYAEYLLGRFAGSSNDDKNQSFERMKAALQQKMKNEIDSRVTEIKNIYKDTSASSYNQVTSSANNLKNLTGRAQSPMTSALLMIHPTSLQANFNKAQKNQDLSGFGNLLNESSFGVDLRENEARIQNQTAIGFGNQSKVLDAQAKRLVNPFFQEEDIQAATNLQQ